MSELSVSSIAFAQRSEAQPFISAKLVRGFFGLVLAIAAIGLWIAPGASDASGVLLLKTGFTAILAFCALAALLPQR